MNLNTNSIHSEFLLRTNMTDFDLKTNYYVRVSQESKKKKNVKHEKIFKKQFKFCFFHHKTILS